MATRTLTYTDIWGHTPTHEVVEDVHGDGLQLLIGHLTPDTAQQRIEDQPWWTPRLLVDTVEHAWIRLDQHSTSCDHPDNDEVPLGQPCGSGRCSWAPWIRWHWHETTPSAAHALPVTFVELDDIPHQTSRESGSVWEVAA